MLVLVQIIRECCCILKRNEVLFSDYDLEDAHHLLIFPFLDSSAWSTRILKHSFPIAQWNFRIFLLIWWLLNLLSTVILSKRQTTLSYRCPKNYCWFLSIQIIKNCHHWNKTFFEIFLFQINFAMPFCLWRKL